MFTKTLDYYYDQEAMLEKRLQLVQEDGDDDELDPGRGYITEEVRNKRTVWTVAVGNNRTNHRAVFPKKLIKPCILAGCPEDGWVLDPFSGSATTGLVALRNNRNYPGIELNPEYGRDSLDRLGNIRSIFISHGRPDCLRETAEVSTA